jgi:hypothetical protein
MFMSEMKTAWFNRNSIPSQVFEHLIRTSRDELVNLAWLENLVEIWGKKEKEKRKHDCIMRRLSRRELNPGLKRDKLAY